MDPSDRLDAFAMAALTGMLARPNSHPPGHAKDQQGYAAAAYEFAEAMVDERERSRLRAIAKLAQFQPQIDPSMLPKEE